MSRQAGILLHPSSLPFTPVCGDLGSNAIHFLDWMVQSGLSIWQTLPLHPPGGGFSPYSSPSIFAGATYLISLEKLLQKGLLHANELHNAPFSKRIDASHIENWKMPKIALAAQRFAEQSPKELQNFIEKNPWVDNWALFQALRTHFKVDGWQDFPEDLKMRRAPALKKWKQTLHLEIQQEIAAQALFFEQWLTLKKEANDRGITILGDMPIFVAANGADTWVDRDLFRWNEKWEADPVSGAPPDAFSKDGQHWGNPLYNWPKHLKNKFSWWEKRIAHELKLADWVRIDHFRGFCAAWEIPRSANGDAKQGQWGPAQGAKLFAHLKSTFPELQLFAEDLGIITDDVHELREKYGLMGMKILQFAFESYEHEYLPHNYTSANWVCYTGTHDNDTAVGWYQNAPEIFKHRYRMVVGRNGSEPHWDLMRLAWSSVAKWAITPMQDIFGLDSSARMNLPGQAGGQWGWRMSDIPWNQVGRLRHLSETYGRLPPTSTDPLQPKVQ